MENLNENQKKASEFLVSSTFGIFLLFLLWFFWVWVDFTMILEYSGAAKYAISDFLWSVFVYSVAVSSIIYIFFLLSKKIISWELSWKNFNQNEREKLEESVRAISIFVFILKKFTWGNMFFILAWSLNDFSWIFFLIKIVFDTIFLLLILFPLKTVKKILSYAFLVFLIIFILQKI